MDLLSKFEVPTATLKVENIQELLVLVKDKSNSINLTKEFWGEVVHLLWHHLKTCLGNLDDQLLCATCFYSVIPLVDQRDQDYYMEKLLHVVGPESNSPSRFIRRSMPGSKRLPFGIELSPNSDHVKTMSTNILRVVSLIYGLFQSSFTTKTDNDKTFKISEILKEIFDLLLPMGYEYSEYTFLVFKIIKSFRKVCGGLLEKYIFNNENNLKLLALVNDNWENPITGVRDLNRSIFQTVISTLDKSTYDRVSKDIEGFYWNKAKYLMLSDIIETYTDDILLLINHKWIDGVVYSLYKPGLVSAGADMYYALLKKINNQDYWCQFFLLHVLKILSGSCIKAIENFCNYWCLTTMKKFRTISNVLIDELEKVEYSDQVLHSKLGILRQANKLGVLDKNWSSTSNNITNYVLAGINNYNTHVRILAFDIICVSQTKSIPTATEYNLILEYLSCNLNSDSTVLRIMLEECITNSYTLTSFDHDKMSSVLQVLENVSNQFVWEEEKSSDFSEMNNMIQNIILASNYSFVDKDDHTKISGLQQIVLNCLWLNVKASCDLAAILIRYNVDDAIMCQRCLNIITRVLETSRHKGAIEAAGTALGKGMNYLTSLPEKKIGDSNPSSGDVTKLPYTLLTCKLNDLISETSKMSSVTRRGAGLSIMLHRIVSNDMKKGKPLFHYFIKTLLQKCKHPGAAQIKKSNSSTDKNVETQLDLPAAIYIHFMTRIVTDSSLATDVMYYSAELAELAFGNLTSSHWQIRNAALQLYGALIPRLIGQKKASGTDDETIATVACDEMLTHLPELWKYIIKQLKQSGGENLLQTHSNLVPILNLLANSAKRYHFSLPVTESDTEIVDLFYHLVVFLGSPIYTVRRLTAKTIFNIYEFQYISDFLLKPKNVTENLLHGMLLLLKLCHNYYACDVRNLRETFKRILGTSQHSYLCKTLYEDVFAIEISKTVIENTLLEWNSNTGPGIHTWAENRFRKFIDKCPWSDIPNLLNLLLAQCNYDDCVTRFLGFLLSRIEKDMIIPTEVLLQIASNLIAFEKKYNCSIIWRILYEISRRTCLRHCIDTAQLLKNLKPQTYNLRYIVPLVARHVDCASNEDKHILLKIIHDFSDFETSDIVMRYTAAIANNELSYNFNELLDSLKVISIKCAVLLLQDEDEDIRNLSVHFYCIISRENRLLQPYICLNRILDKSFLNVIFTEPEKSIEELNRELTAIVQFVHQVDEYNPFANESKNIYFEPDILKDMVESLNIHS
ncbi:unnamed protein product [Arctia plantaginis]|uniref:DUF2428 domain-containing protein n=1 Tax=Arctia plantaginis TaxID=874455 RepID=A0A8S1B258_ARCPL|nr:unnamed protein product [Arctia plantaginis]CAB3255670.1 unnamed protein product [Arctia plantaginis]